MVSAGKETTRRKKKQEETTRALELLLIYVVLAATNQMLPHFQPFIFGSLGKHLVLLENQLIKRRLVSEPILCTRHSCCIFFIPMQNKHEPTVPRWVDDVEV